MQHVKRVIVMTGASGYVGTRVLKLALSRGFAVHSLGRAPLRQEGVVNLPFDFSRPVDVTLPPNTVALLHLAANTSSSSELFEREEVAAAKVLAAAMPNGARLIFVSSQSAAECAPTAYGRTKWHIEEVVKSFGGISVRPGLVFGGPERGLFGRICAVVQISPLLPFFLLPRPLVQPIHVDDLADGLLRLVDEQRPFARPVCLAGQPIPFDRFLHAIARHRYGVWRLFVPMPMSVAQIALELFEYLSRRPVGAPQLRSLARTEAMDAANDLDGLGLVLRPLDKGLRKRPVSERRRLIHEGARVLTYVLGSTPGNGLIQRYVRFVEARNAISILNCPASLWWSVKAIAILDYHGTTQVQERQLVERIQLAMRVAEASPQSTARFIGKFGSLNGPQPIRAAVAIGAAIAREVLLRFTRPLLLPAAGRLLRRPTRV